MDVRTRSISSSIVDFFRRPAETSTGHHNGNVTFKNHDNEEDGIADDASIELRGTGPLGSGDIESPNFQGSLILYETDSEVRPPVLPILPVQRLRLLRQKQEMRRKLSLSALYSLQAPHMAFSDQHGYDLSVVNPNTSSFSQQPSSTPSPVKHTVKEDKLDGLKSLKRKKITKNLRRGTKWSGEFEYDLSEYDNQKKVAKTIITDADNDHMDSPSLSLVKPVVARREAYQDVNTNSLSAAQRDLLLKGQPSPLFGSKQLEKPQNSKAITSSLSNESRLEDHKSSENDKILLPSVGFDFIKGNDTPSKPSPSKFDGPQTPTSSSFKVDGKNPHVKFTFSSKPSTSTPDAESHGGNASANLAENKPSAGLSEAPSTAIAPKPFSFEEKPKANSHKNYEEDRDDSEPKRKRPTRGESSDAPRFSFSSAIPAGQSATDKPTFAFGSKSNNESIEKPSSLGTTPFTFGGKSKSALESKSRLGSNNIAGTSSLSTKPTKEQPNTPSDLPQLNSGKSSAVPSFSFGTKEKGGLVTQPSFSFGSKKEGTSSGATAFSFGNKTNNEAISKLSFNFGESSKAVATADPQQNPSDASKQSSGSNTNDGTSVRNEKPKFSFGKSTSDSKASLAAPSFSFGTNKDTAVEEKKSTPGSSLTFGNNDQAHAKPVIASTSSGGFSFNRISKPADDKATKPSFTFGQKDAPSPAFSVTGGEPNKFSSFKSEAPSTSETPVANNTGFSFTKNGSSQAAGNSWVGTTGNSTKPNTTNFAFKFGTGNTTSVPNAAPQAAPLSVPGANPNPFIGAGKGTNGFSFGTSVGNVGTTAGATTSFSNPQPLQAPFGTTPSPSFGKSATPPAIGNSGNSSRAFTPSNTVNLNFSNNASVDPSAIFSGASNQPSMPVVSSVPPQQVFGGTPPPSQIFGAVPQPTAPFSNAPIGFGSTGGLAAGQLAQPVQQAPASNFQLPPGRKLARMRQSRRG